MRVLSTISVIRNVIHTTGEFDSESGVSNTVGVAIAFLLSLRVVTAGSACILAFCFF